MIKKLEWDSSFFNIEVGEIDTKQSSGEIVPDCYFDVIYVKQEQDIPLQITNFTKTLQETKTIFSKSIEEINLNTSVNVIDFDDFPLNNEELYELAYISGQHSRFLLDEKFGIEKFKELYRMWIDNSINKRFAKKIFYTKDNNTITSFATYQEVDNIGKIGLIATSPSYQGRGLGKTLLNKVEYYCKENNIKALDIPTQKENTNACKFYTACGYNIKEEVIIKHYWRSKPDY